METGKNELGGTITSHSDCNHPQTTIYFQDLCYRHRYIRSRDTSLVFERPERLRAVKVGLAAALSRLEDLVTSDPSRSSSISHGSDASRSISPSPDEGGLVAALDRMSINSSDLVDFRDLRLNVVQSGATVDVLNHPAVKFIHGDVERDVYLENLVSWVKNSQEKISAGGVEIPDDFSPTDLYLCPGSLDAIQGAIGTVCEAVDGVVKSTLPSARDSMPPSVKAAGSRAFVAIRPPGHHCGEDTPSGFCFVNNVAIAAAHAHLQHGINRVVIFDIDLHHGNGTQSIAWQINEETHRLTLESENANTGGSKKPGLQIYYGSLHDILSYPCEDGKPELVQAASVSIHGPHGQHVENIHLQPYSSEEHFWNVLYKDYRQLLTKAESFLSQSSSTEDTLFLISCGFDACEHEYPAMSRHGRKVPVSFYHRFTQDAIALAERYAQGRIISVLEGGYSDRALISGAMAHLCGLVDIRGLDVDESWWSVQNLDKLEQATKKRRGNQPRVTEHWIERTTAILSRIDAGSAYHLAAPASTRNANLPPSSSSMTLRERKKPTSAEPSPAPSPDKPKSGKTAKASVVSEEQDKDRIFRELQHDDKRLVVSESGEHQTSTAKKLPRVILRLGPHPDTAS